jgi:hypothetical protein
VPYPGRPGRVVTTAGNLVMHGADGHLIASTPLTNLPDGKQYISVLSGRNGGRLFTFWTARSRFRRLCRRPPDEDAALHRVLPLRHVEETGSISDAPTVQLGRRANKKAAEGIHWDEAGEYRFPVGGSWWATLLTAAVKHSAMSIMSALRARENGRVLKSFITITVVIFVLALVSCKPSSSSSSPNPVVYFQFGDSSHKDVFVFATDKPAVIRQARRILSGEEKTKTKVMGTIVKSEEPYNPGWSFHLDPSSVTFFQASSEACDATTRYVSDHLDDIGKDFLPGSKWCPWSSYLIAELSAPLLKPASTDCFKSHPLASGKKMELRNTCNVCKTAVINYEDANSGGGAQPVSKEFRVLGHSSVEIEVSGARTELVDQKDCKK